MAPAAEPHSERGGRDRRPPSSPRGPILAGLLVIALAFGGFGTRAALAPLNSAAIAPGKVAVEGKRKTVQHLEGGIIAAIPVHEGQHVTAGEVLVRLDATHARTTVERLTARHRAAAALAARLTAECDDGQTIAFPAWLTQEAATDPAVQAALAGQRALFAARRESLRGGEAILRQRIA
jgi:multidrug efflux pump subunit AcrA (membrane-fusion protein)